MGMGGIAWYGRACWALWPPCSVGWSGGDLERQVQAASAWGAGQAQQASRLIYQWHGTAGAPRDAENGLKKYFFLHVNIRAVPLGFSDHKPHVRLGLGV